MNITPTGRCNTTPEYYFKIGLNSSLKNVGIYRKLVDKVQDIDTHIITSDNSQWKFKCYNGDRFEKIRNFYGIELNYYINSLCNENMISGRIYPKSGAKFWKTSDNKYIVKTITKNDLSKDDSFLFFIIFPPLFFNTSITKKYRYQLIFVLKYYCYNFQFKYSRFSYVRFYFYVNSSR